MIRKAIIVVLTVAAVGVVAIGFVGIVLPGDHAVHFALAENRSVEIHLQRATLWIRHSTWYYRNPPPFKKRVINAWFFLYFTTEVDGGIGDDPPICEHWHRFYVLLWVPAVLLAAYPTVALIRGPLRRYRRRKHGLCIKCGYDLTGNVTGMCPECGAAM